MPLFSKPILTSHVKHLLATWALSSADHWEGGKLDLRGRVGLRADVGIAALFVPTITEKKLDPCHHRADDFPM